MRLTGCTALVLLLAVCGYWGAGRQKTTGVSVPVAVETVSESVLSAASMEETQRRLRDERESALALLQSVLEEPAADERIKSDALAKKTEMAARMEKEAALCAALAHMGFDGAAVVLGENAATVIVPWQAAESEQNRVKIIDAAVSHTGLAPENVKIILSKMMEKIVRRTKICYTNE